MGYFISFSKSELETLRLFDEFSDTEKIAKELNKSKSQTYRIIKKLKEKKAIEKNKLSDIPYLKKLVLLIRKNKNLVELFGDSGLPILLQTNSPKQISEIARDVNCDEQTVYKIIQKARGIGLVKKVEKEYVINSKNWSDAKDFLDSLLDQEMSFDKRVSKNSIIYFKSEKEILFSTNDSVDASLTAFSAFEKFGVKMFPDTNYYVLPKQRVSAQRVFDDALIILKKNWDYRLLVVFGVFILKNKIRSGNDVVMNFYKIFDGASIEGYPSAEDLKEKAKLYGVKL